MARPKTPVALAAAPAAPVDTSKWPKSLGEWFAVRDAWPRPIPSKLHRYIQRGFMTVEESKIARAKQKQAEKDRWEARNTPEARREQRNQYIEERRRKHPGPKPRLFIGRESGPRYQVVTVQGKHKAFYRRVRAPSQPAEFYVIEDKTQSAFKVGVAVDAASRFNSYGTHTLNDLSMYFTHGMPGLKSARRHERAFLRLLEEYRVSGTEWVRATKEQVDAALKELFEF